MGEVERPPPIVLASASAIRHQLLARAGVQFSVVPASIDERSLSAEFAGLPIADRALALAEAKALNVAVRHSGALVIGADQILELDGVVVHKAPDLQSARLILERMRGRSHKLHSAIAIAQNDIVLWRAVPSAVLTMRNFSSTWLDKYIDRAGDVLTKSVGAYQLEGEGVQLFDRIEGDYFTILGLPLFALLAELRRLKALPE